MADLLPTKTPSVLFVGGSMNQTTQMHQIARELPEYDRWFSPFYADGFVGLAARLGLADGTVAGKRHVARCLKYFHEHGLQIDHGGTRGGYDLILICSDLVVPNNQRASRLVLVQEGMTDPEGLAYHLVRRLKFLPRWLASTASAGLSDAYDVFCVASEGYRDLFIRKGARPEKLVVTGIPNFDNCARFLINDFPHRHYVLVCTSDTRETFGFENRRKFILNALRIADGRQMIFKLHPNERVDRATREIRRWAPGALVYPTGKTEEMIANCDVLITRFSTTVYVGLALGKEVYSEFDVEELREMTPLQNASAAKNIAAVCRGLLERPGDRRPPVVKKHSRNLRWSKVSAYGRQARKLNGAAS